MTRLFHVCALGLLFVAVVFDFLVVAAGPANSDPEASLSAVVNTAGLRLDHKSRIVDDQMEYAFSQTDCAALVRIRLYPSIHRDAEQAIQWSKLQGSRSYLVYRGARAGSSYGALMLHWVEAKLAILFRFAPKTNWDSKLLAVAIPIACAEPKIEWSQVLDTRR